MISDRVRVAAYSEALRKAVKPGCVVGEIGAGTGVFSMLACQLGARRVYAIEADSIIQVGREAAATNGFADRIVFLQDMSTRVQLPERCDVIVSEIHGVLPWFEMHIPSIVDARERLLTSGGILIPQRETLWAAVVEAPELHSRLLDPWTRNPFGFDMRAASQLAINEWQKARVKPEQLLTEPVCCATVDYTTVTDTGFSADSVWNVARGGTGSGFIAWYDSVLCDGVGFSNSPSSPELIFGSAYFPWPEEVKLNEGDRVSLALGAHLVGTDYLWRWETSIFQPGNRSEPTARFQQSTFSGTPFTPETLRKRSSSYAPNLNEDGQIDQFILASLNGSITLGELAGLLVEKFPNQFASRQAALNRAADCSQKYGQ
jgi:protein arginine N-methyltransferase 1